MPLFTENPPKEKPNKPLKPGKGYGIVALLCGLEPVLVIGFTTLCDLLNPAILYTSPWYEIADVLGFFGIPCALAALIFGIKGRKTEGKLYAHIGLGLFLLFGVAQKDCKVVEKSSLPRRRESRRKGLNFFVSIPACAGMTMEKDFAILLGHCVSPYA
jgi:hypothetical protein